jgi:sulfur carrier protein ThiS
MSQYIEDIGVLQHIKVEEQKTVAQLLEELKLIDKYFVVLVNGKKAELTDLVSTTDDIIVLPQLVGGF